MVLLKRLIIVLILQVPVSSLLARYCQALVLILQVLPGTNTDSPGTCLIITGVLPQSPQSGQVGGCPGASVGMLAACGGILGRAEMAHSRKKAGRHEGQVRLAEKAE